MANIGRIAFSLLSGVQEAQLALASLNFDFSLIKIEAPPAFHGVGTALTQNRRQVAESGEIHVTARKLGAIFEGLVPPTPALFDAYGSRASEIANESIKTHTKGIFSDFVGPDATSIWAAATSGHAAIAVHLLACLLARIWKPAEAVSIWEDLMTTRQAQLAEDCKPGTSTFQASSYFANQVTVTRDQLAKWDHSARSWLGHADKVQYNRQTKVKFVVDELRLPVSSKTSAYESVIEVWTTALQGMEKLLAGKSQGVSRSSLAATTSIVLALTSWHLYPDISLSGSAPVMQQDPLFPNGSLITLNLSGNPSRQVPGIYWSLSLSHLRYYGHPVHTERTYATESSRILFPQLLQIVLGSISAYWKSEGADMRKVAAVVVELYQSATRTRCLKPPWIRMLHDAAEDFVKSREVWQDMNKRLFRLGREKCSTILCDVHPSPVFGLSDLALFVKALKSPHRRLTILRKYAKRWFPQAEQSKVIIRYRMPRSDVVFQELKPVKMEVSVDFSQEEHKPKSEPTEMLDGEQFPTAVKLELTEDKPHEHVEPSVFPRQHAEDIVTVTTALPRPGNENDEPGLYTSWTQEKGPFHVKSTEDDPYNTTDWLFGCELDVFQKLGDWKVVSNTFRFQQVRQGTRALKRKRETEEESDDERKNNKREDEDMDTYKLFLGDEEMGAIFVEKRVLDQHEKDWCAPSWARLPRIKRTVDISDILAALKEDALDLSIWSEASSDREAPFCQALFALTRAWDLYKNFDGATISPEAFQQPIVDRAWAKSIVKKYKSSPYAAQMTCEEAFACITNFESGEIDLSADKFSGVMAVSVTDSIYVSARLLSDPAECLPANMIKRLNGNVGRPDVTIMIPPAEPMVLQPSADRWRFIDREAFGGQRDDDFGRTTLHLSFTDWSSPIDMGKAARGQRSTAAHIVETLVSVHDDGRWIAELDVLAALNKGSAQPDHEYFYRATCRHPAEQDAVADDVDQELVTIRNWDEFLDRPNCPAVVMAHGNWEAKLAMTTLGVSRGDRVFLGKYVCASCLRDLVEVGGEEMGRKALVLV